MGLFADDVAADGTDRLTAGFSLLQVVELRRADVETARQKGPVRAGDFGVASMTSASSTVDWAVSLTISEV